MAKSAEKVRPISVRMPHAAKMLDLHYDTLRDMVTRGVFTALRSRGHGAGKPVFIPTDEVELYGETRDEDAVRALRVKKKRLKAR